MGTWMMPRICSRLRVQRLLTSQWGQRGAVASEYALLLVLVAIAVVGALTAVGFAVATLFETTGTSPPLSGGGP